MNLDMDRILASKRAYRSRLAALPIAEKLRLIGALRERAVVLREAGAVRARTGLAVLMRDVYTWWLQWRHFSLDVYKKLRFGIHIYGLGPAT